MSLREKDNNKTPKVLVLAQNKIQPFTGGGVVLSNLFGQFPEDKLLFFHRDQEYGVTTAYQEHQLVWHWLRADINAMVMIFVKWFIQVLFYKKKMHFRDFSRLVAQSCYFQFPKNIDEMIRRFQPDVLYCWASDSLWAETAYRVAERYTLPYAIHFMDNHLGKQSETAFEYATDALFQKRLNKLVKNAVSIYTVSKSMGEAYKRLWTKPYEVFHGTIDSSTWPLPNPMPNSNNGFNIVFTGSIEHGQLAGIKDVANAIESLRNKGINIHLALYLTERYMQFAKTVLSSYNCVKFIPHPNFSSLRNELSKADLLLLAYGFDIQTIDYYRHSFSTKIVPYMLSGRAILVYGPSEIEPVKYARRGSWAEIVDTDNKAVLISKIEKLMNDSSRREQLSISAWMVAKKDSDLNSNAQRFRKSLIRISASKQKKRF